MRARIAIGLVLVGGCGMSSPGDGDDNPPPKVDPNISIPCMQSVSRLPVSGGHDGLVVTSGCADVGATVSNVQLTADSQLAAVEAFSDWDFRFTRTIPAELTNQAPEDVLALVDGNSAAGAPRAFAFLRSGSDQVRTGQPLAFDHPIQDLAGADLDGDGFPDLLVTAGEGSLGAGDLRFVPGTAAGLPTTIDASNETVLLSGATYNYAVAVDLGGPPDLDLLYVGLQLLGQGTFSQISIAMRETGAAPGAPPSFGEPIVQSLVGMPGLIPGPLPPLLVGDIDGDGHPDVVGAVPQLFAWLSTTQTITILDNTPELIALGDLDGDGVKEIIAQTFGTVRRVAHAGSSFQTTTVLPFGGQAMAVADIDGDGRDDIILANDLNLDSSSLIAHLSLAP